LNILRDKKIHLIQLIVLSLFISITAVSLKPILDETEKRMTKIKSDLIEALENSINYEISYSSISPSIFSFIGIKDLTIYKDKENDVILANIHSFKAFYSPFYFFNKNASKTPLQAVRRFTINNVSVFFNQLRDEELLSLFDSDKKSEISLFPLKTTFTGKNIELVIETLDGVFKAEDLFVSLTPENNSYKTRIEGKLSGEINHTNFIIQEFDSRISVKGTLAEYFDSLNFTVKTNGFTSNLIDLKDQSFQLLSTSEVLVLRKVEDDRPIDLFLRYDRVLKDVVITFNAEEFQPDTIFELKDSLEKFAPYTSSTITGDGSLLINKSSSVFLYSLKSEIELNRSIFNRTISLKTDFTGDNKVINVRSLDLTTIEGKILFTGDVLAGSFFPSGTLTLKNIETPYGYTINSKLDIKRDSGFLYLTSPAINLGSSNIKNMDLVVFPGNKIITSSFKAEIIDEKGQTGEVIADSFLEFSKEPQFKTYITLSQLPMREIFNFLPVQSSVIPIPDELQEMSLYGDINLTSNFKSVNAQVNKVLLISEENAENQLSFSALYDNTGFKINDLYLNWNKYNLNGYINSDKKNDEYIITTLFDLQEKPYRIQAVYSKEELFFEGDYGIYGFLQNLNKETRTFTLKTTDLPIPVNEEFLLASLDINGYLSENDWKVYLNNTGLRTAKILTLQSPELFISGEIDKSGGNFSNISYKDNFSGLKGQGRFTYDTNEFSSWISLIDDSGKTDEQYDLFFSRINKETESRVSIISTPVERFNQSGLSGKITCDLAYKGTPGNPDIRAFFNSEDMNLNGIPVKISSYLKGNKNVIRVTDLELTYNNLMVDRGLILLEMDKGKLLTTAAIHQNINRSTASTAITALITSDSSFDIYSFNRLNTSELNGKISISPIVWNNMVTFPKLDFLLKKENKLFSAEVSKANVFYADYHMETGDFTVNISDLFPVKFQSRGNFKNSVIDVNVNKIRFDPGFINYFMPTDPYKGKRHVVFNGGEITGDLHITGKISDPDVYGKLELGNLLVESPYLAEVPKAVSTTAYFDGNDITLDPLIIALHEGSLEAKAFFELDGALPTTYNVDVKITGSSGARVAYEIPKFSWDGHFTGFAHIEGSKSGGFLKGTVISNDLKSSIESSVYMRITPKRIINPSVNGFIVDLTLQTGRDVTFYLPNEDVPIIQATADNGDTISIGYDSRSDVLALIGRIDIRTGQINYFNKTFYLQEGYIEFNESQVKFNPRLNIRADVETQDEEGDDVTISLLLDDYLMNEFNPEFFSFPSKSESEILALLGQSFIPSSDSDNVSVASLLVSTGSMVGKNTIMHPFEEAIKSSLQLDFVSFNTNIIENAILDRLQDEDLDDSDSDSMNFASYLEDTSLFVGEYIGDYLFLEGSLVVDYDESNADSSTLGGLELLINLNLQFITPFVLIDWSYNPKNNPDSDYFLPQNTLTFTWRYSY
jgi:hypothetical protein